MAAAISECKSVLGCSSSSHGSDLWLSALRSVWLTESRVEPFRPNWSFQLSLHPCSQYPYLCTEHSLFIRLMELTWQTNRLHWALCFDFFPRFWFPPTQPAPVTSSQRIFDIILNSDLSKFISFHDSNNSLRSSFKRLWLQGLLGTFLRSKVKANQAIEAELKQIFCIKATTSYP